MREASVYSAFRPGSFCKGWAASPSHIAARVLGSGFRVSGLGFTPIMENEVEKKMENEMETATYIYISIYIYRFI